MSFYSTSEFNAQVDVYVAQGMSEAAAYCKVRENEAEDAADYDSWLVNTELFETEE